MNISRGLEKFYQAIKNEPVEYQTISLQEMTHSPGMNMGLDSIAILLAVLIAAFIFAVKN